MIDPFYMGWTSGGIATDAAKVIPIRWLSQIEPIARHPGQVLSLFSLRASLKQDSTSHLKIYLSSLWSVLYTMYWLVLLSEYERNKKVAQR